MCEANVDVGEWAFVVLNCVQSVKKQALTISYDNKNAK